MKYEEMSDFEINKQVASILYDEDWWHKNGKVIINRQGTDLFGDKFSGKVEVDYCNNPLDAWPIILENKIGIREYDGFWEARSYNPEIALCNKNPLHAAMIVFLMMNEEQK